MRFTPTPEQQQLGDMVQRFLGEQYGFEVRRKILDSREGWSLEIWSKLAELGLLSLEVPEEQGGMAPAAVETLLTATATGKAMHFEPGARHDLQQIATAARRSGGAWTVKGQKSVVLHAPAADLLLVSARTSGAPDEPNGVSLFAVARDGPGVSLSPYRTLDGMCAADVELTGAAGALIGAEGAAFACLLAAFDQGLAARCAEAVGALQAIR